MSNSRAYGEFVKQESHTSRTSGYIQWGSAKVSIGSCLLLNPGSADFEKIKPDLFEELESTGIAQGLVRTDPTMGRLIAIVERIYKPAQPNGRFHIYNLVSVQNSELSTAIEEFDRLVESGDYDPASSLVSIEELRSHPWILLGWGCDEDDFSDELLEIKSTWWNLIEESGIPRFGKKHPKDKGYYHPIYAVYRPKLIDELVEIYRETVN